MPATTSRVRIFGVCNDSAPRASGHGHVLCGNNGRLEDHSAVLPMEQHGVGVVEGPAQDEGED